VLVNDAGLIQVGPLQHLQLEDFRDALGVHFWGPLYTMLAALPYLRAGGGGRIVNIASIGGKIPIPQLSPYCASKFALVGYSNGLRVELARQGIVVTTVCPGLMRTGSPGRAFFKSQHRSEYAWFSISDSLPLITMSAEYAARQVLDACRRGRGEVVLGFPYQVAAKLHALFPDLSMDVLSFVNRLLPGPGGVGTELREGRESQSWASPSLVTALTEKAAVRNNETAPSPSS